MIKDAVHFQNGCKLIDLVTGGSKGVYGYPSGRIINICGDKSSGKSSLVNEIIAWSYWNYKDKFKWMYADCERGYSFDTEPVYGFQIHTDESDTPTTVEEAFYCIDKFAKSLKKDEFGIYVLDSLDALTSDEQDARAEERIKAIENDKEMKGTYGMGKAKYLSQEFFPQLCKTLEDKNILLIIISQIRDNTDMFSFEKYSRSGGKALDFYCHMVIWLATAKKITVEKGEQKAVTGGTNKLKVTKGKVPRPYRECFYTYYFTFGIDNIATGVDYLFDLRTKSGDISAPVAKACEWEKDKNKRSMSPSDIKDWLMELKRYDDYRATLKSGERFSIETALAFISSDGELKEKFNNEFAKVMDRDTLIKYIEDNNLEEELNRRIEEKWEAFESTLVLDRKPKYGKFYSQQPRSTDEDVII